MKRFFAGFAVLAAVAVIIVSCGEKEKASGPPAPTAITTTEQGAQTAKVGATTAQNIIEGTISLSSLAESSPLKLAQQSRAGKALAKTVARLNTKIKKAKAMRLAKAPQDISSSACPQGGSATMDMTETSLSLTYSDCKYQGSKATGTATMSCSDANCTSLTLAENITVINYVQTSTAGYEYATEESKYVGNETLTLTANSATSFSITMNGAESYEELAGAGYPRYKEDVSFNGVSFSGSDNSTTAVESFNITANGSLSWSGYEDTGDGRGFVLAASEADSFSNLAVDWSRTKSTSVETFSINGMFTLSVTPDDCAEGTYVFETVVPVTFDPAKGTFTAGELKVNSTVVVRYTATGAVEVSIDGGKTFSTYSAEELAAFCPNL